MHHVYAAPVGFLSSKRMLNFYLNGEIPKDKSMDLELFMSQREHIYNLPNQIHDNNRLASGYNSEDTLSDVFDKSVKRLSNLLYCADDKIYVKDENLSAWQEVLINIGSAPIIAWAIKDCPDDYIEKNKHSMSLLPNIKKDLKINNLLMELHLHINGTSEATHNWLYFLQNEKKVYEVLKKSYDKATIQYKQLGINSVEMFINIISKAKHVREFLFDYAEKTTAYESKLTKTFERLWLNYFRDNWVSEIPYTGSIDLYRDYDKIYSLQSELAMWYKLFSVNNITSYTIQQKNIIYMLMHFYILSMSLFNKFLVQQSDQYGFSQFQLITDNKLRDAYEDEGYTDRYIQLRGMYNATYNLSHIELRFAPKNTTTEMAKLYKKIISDHLLLFDKKEINCNIATVAHFIKFPDRNFTDGLPLACRWANARSKIERQAQVLLATIGSTKMEAYMGEDKMSLFDKFVGIDAAGNELYARPEVFAPTFNKLHDQFLERFKKRLNLTFHAGEDYVHLLSGIRYIWEAIHFLGMNEENKWEKCRIGHATALGIYPDFWADKLDNVIVMSKGEWLDSMIFACYFYSTCQYDYSIEKLWKYIYGRTKPDCEKVWESYIARKEDPYECKDELNKLYNSPDVVKRYNEMLTVEINNHDIEIMLKLQRKILKLMKDKDIAIESMITSNVRISYYDTYEQHHIYRWLFPEGVEEGIIPPIVLASDDPGLFNNNLRIEFSHLYEILKKKGKKDSEIQNKIAELQSNAKKFVFR